VRETGVATPFVASDARAFVPGREYVVELIQLLLYYLKHMEEPINSLAA
jgi:hypothetical protein